MCGIVGMISKQGQIWGDHDDLFEEMLLVDGVRGLDSTGAFAVYGKNEVEIVKQAVNPGVFIETNAWKDFKGAINRRGRILVGHNRKATVGSVNTKNAHPFVDKDIVLVHNGYIGNSKSIDASKEVDSETIVTALDKEKNYLEGLRSLVGAFAIVWYNHRNKTLYITRNKERPMWYAQGTSMFYFASEGMMLHWLLSRRNFAHDRPVFMEENAVLEITLNPFTIKEAKIPEKVYHRPPTTVWTPNSNDSQYSGDPAFIEDDKPVPTIGQPPAAIRAKELLREYAQDSLVFFTPKSASTGDSRNIIYGHAWVPGKDPTKAQYTVDSNKDTEEWLNFDVPLVGHVQAVASHNHDVYLILKNVRRPSGVLKDWNDQSMGDEEWHSICDKLICDSCAKPPRSTTPESTVIGRKGPGHYEVMCSVCLDSYTAPRKLVKADDKTDKPSING